MPRKPKFRPRIMRVKLNPEQAVLLCSCFSVGLQQTMSMFAGGQACNVGIFRATENSCASAPGAVSS